jgi:hypothetical protein
VVFGELLQTYHNSGYQPIVPHLPGGSEVKDSAGRFAFEIPWPWYELDSTALRGSKAEIAVTAARFTGTGPLFTLSATDDRDSLTADNPNSRGKHLAKQSGVTPSSVEKVLVDGHRGLLVNGADRSTGEPATLILIPHPALSVLGRADYGPSGHGYLIHVRSMLASWTWLT